MTGAAPVGPRVGYLVKRFPRLSETFVLGEIREVRRQGLPLDLHALMDPVEGVSQPEALALVPEVHYLHDARRRARSWVRLLAGAVAQAARNPQGALRVARAVALVHRSRAGVRHAIEGLCLARRLRERGVDHLHAHFAHSPAAVAHLCRLAGGPPFSFTAHAKDLYTTDERPLRARLAAAEFVVTCTKANARHIHDLTGAASVPVHVVYHGIDPGSAPVGTHPRDGGRILTVGRLVPKKGHADVLEALAQLRRRGRRLHWDVFGSGPLRLDLEAAAARLDMGASVHLRGARPQAEVFTSLRSASVFVLAPVVLADGDRDGIPNVLVEAMAHGVPVVSTSVSGIPELIDDGVDGLLVPPGDPEALAQAIARILDDEALALRLAGAARRTVETRFDSRTAAARLIGLFRTGRDEMQTAREEVA